MELTELKAKWNEMDSRLSNIEIINKKAVRELTSIKTASAITQLKNTSWYGALSTLFVSAIMIYFFGHNEEIRSIMNPNSIMAIIAVLVLGTAYTLYKALRISKLDVSIPTVELMVKTNKMRRFLLIERLSSYFIVVALYIAVFCLEGKWIVERGRVLAAALLLVGLCVIVTIVFIVAKRRDQKMLDDIDKNLKELSELD